MSKQINNEINNKINNEKSIQDIALVNLPSTTEFITNKETGKVETVNIKSKNIKLWYLMINRC